MTYRGHSKWLKLMNNFIVGYNKMIYNQNSYVFSVIE